MAGGQSANERRRRGRRIGLIEMGERETIEALEATVMKVLAGTGLH
jgi:hypothetical protein